MEMDGFCWFELKPLGPDQVQVAVPDDVVLADKFMVPPLQIGFTAGTAGVAGGFGSDKEKLNALDVQPLAVTVIPE